jgi:hypothetical protein
MIVIYLLILKLLNLPFSRILTIILDGHTPEIRIVPLVFIALLVHLL